LTSGAIHLVKLNWQNNPRVRGSPLEPTSTPTAKQQTLTVYLFSVGQGDHLLLELPNGEFGLMDFHWDYEHNPGHEPPGLTFLKQRHASGKPVVISFLCISHPDFDHVKGLCKVLEWIKENHIELRRIWLYSGVDEADAHRALAKVKKFLKKIRAQNSSSGLGKAPVGAPNNSTILRVEDELQCLREFVKDRSLTPDLIQGIGHLANLAETVEVCCLAPLADDIRKANEQTIISIFLWAHYLKPKLKFPDRNRLSSIIKMKFGSHQLLFGGDASEATWQRSIDEFEQRHEGNEGPCDPSLRASFIKASHHGSGNSSAVRLWEAVLANKSHVGISAGKGQHHPNAKTLDDVRTASRNLGSIAHFHTTNVCSKCVIAERVPEEDWSWLPAAVKLPRREETTEALKLDAPVHFSVANDSKNASRIAVMREAPRPVAMTERLKESHKRGALIAYIFRFPSHGDQVSVSKATADSPKRRDCIFEYEGEQCFPQCADSY
jgi:beta-lactamase superfamily II metal-dependent hydrolase